MSTRYSMYPPGVPDGIEVIQIDKELPLPKYATSGSAGLDLYSTADTGLIPGQTALIPTGIAVHIKNPLHVGLVYPRSGLSTKQGLVLLNSVGVIDSDYQGEIMVCMYKIENSVHKAVIRRGDRIAQLVITTITRPALTVVDQFTQSTARGVGGFGSTGQ